MPKELKLKWETPEAVRADLLETFPYQGERQRIVYTSKEFSAVCPFSGLPDIATVSVEYVPHELCIELRSLKYYFISYRNVGIYQEEATNRIYQDLVKLVRPSYLKVTTVYNTRGGIDSTCAIETPEKEPKR
jgi:7-cyano-7-deazaguanine reductase